MSRIVGAFGIAVMVFVMALATGIGGSPSTAEAAPGGQFSPPAGSSFTTINGQQFNVIRLWKFPPPTSTPGN